ncbi:MAG: toxin-antitoxin system YwqK family antitoxin, partial [Bacteroidales bacterium]|nr:toxin-antitoxin system YwqK family antitoxin [Bacteroidales bacterium]
DSLTGKVVLGIVVHDGEVLGSEQVDEYGNKSNEMYEERYPDGTLKCTGRLYKGKRYGKWKFYFPDGRLEQEGEYRNGLAEGIWSWYFPDGGLRSEQEYRYGKLDGISVEYDDSARVVAKGRYSDDLEDGHWEYFRQGEVTQGEYRFGEKEGLWKSYWSKDGKKRLSFQGYYTGGFPDGRHQYFDEDGNLKQEGYFRQGKRVGTWIKYDRTGQPEMRIRYDNREEETRYNGRRTVSREQEKAFREENVRLAE